MQICMKFADTNFIGWLICRFRLGIRYVTTTFCDILLKHPALNQ